MNSDVSFAISEPGPVASSPGDTAPLPAAVPPVRARDFFRRAYRAGMVVRFDGRRWEVDCVEFWRRDEKLSLREIDGVGRVRTREVWASKVEIDAHTMPEDLPPAPGSHEL